MSAVMDTLPLFDDGRIDDRWAKLSTTGLYRYELGRRWDRDAALCGFVMLNPSTADADLDDQTIRRCGHLARTHGHGGIYVVNLYAWRATKPAELWRAPDPVGRDNDWHLTWAAQSPTIGTWVAAWGNLPARATARARQVTDLFRGSGHELLCPGTTKSGAPRHPSRLGNDVALIPWSPTWT